MPVDSMSAENRVVAFRDFVGNMHKIHGTVHSDRAKETVKAVDYLRKEKKGVAGPSSVKLA
mgnify:CR=1 FL=1